MFLDDLNTRNLPPVIPEGMTADKWREYRKQVIDLFAREEYGYLPPAPKSVHAEVLQSQLGEWAGKAEHSEVALSFETPGGKYSFPVHLVLTESEKKLPLIVYISFTPYPCGSYGPIEEIVDSGYSLAIFCYNDVAKDEDDGFAGGIAAMFDRRDDDGSMWGKISMWAWAASRVMDYVQTLDQIDKNRIYVVGHSRLGKTALWCAVQDERFAGVGVNCSGCSGAAITRGKKGEHVSDIVQRFPFWFCNNYNKYAGREEEMPFDQNMLTALMAPRLLAVCDAVEDIWCDPDSEYMSLYEASNAYDLLNVSGLAAPADYPAVGVELLDGRMGYRLRTGTHFLSRHDWMLYIKFFNMH